MNYENYLQSDMLSDLVKSITDNRTELTAEAMTLRLQALAQDAYAHGFTDKSLNTQDAGGIKKSSMLTSLTPSSYIKGDGTKLVNTIMASFANFVDASDGTVAIGYENELKKVIETVIRVAYSVGVSVGTKIAGDEDLTAMYKNNEKRFMVRDK